MILSSFSQAHSEQSDKARTKYAPRPNSSIIIEDVGQFSTLNILSISKFHLGSTMRYGESLEGRKSVLIVRKSTLSTMGCRLVVLLIAQSFVGLTYVTNYSVNPQPTSYSANTDLRPYHQNRATEHSRALSAVPVVPSVIDLPLEVMRLPG